LLHGKETAEYVPPVSVMVGTSHIADALTPAPLKENAIVKTPH